MIFNFGLRCGDFQNSEFPFVPPTLSGKNGNSEIRKFGDAEKKNCEQGFTDTQSILGAELSLPRYLIINDIWKRLRP